ncbi:uncharacterized protein (DUF885 family) [Caulobacter sp. BE264]|uniref:DUF885 domain-containing protein n=1 Tax=Caulobacter sp. BE264 TaxID=2817724 RepID=UPI0028629C10|nr:DUF885 domain-containing protein [Caulobacter sp. BE264]MDR7229987.1 uncharacterized protein (DUF885 family) [Caulobacter sp. BE264]
MLSRRQALAGGAAVGATLMASQARASNDAALRVLLDTLAKGGSAADRLAALKAFPAEGLSPYARLDRDAILQALETEAEIARRFPFVGGSGSPYAVTTRTGAWLRTAEAVKAGGEAVDALARRVAAETEKLRADAGLGVLPPGFVIDKVVAGLAKASVGAPEGLAKALAAQAEALAMLRPRAGDGGVRFKDAEAYYALVLKANLGAAITPAEAHARGLDACRRFSARADGLLRARGLTKGSVGARLTAFSRDPRFLYSDDDAGRDRLVADMNAWLDKAKSRLSRSFGAVPKGAWTSQVSRMSTADEAAARQGYREAPSFDGKRSGVYFVDLAAIRSRPRWTLASVAHHECVPGHMLQIPMEEGAGAHPLRTRLACPGFSEGWSIYAEQLADEEGAFAGDPLAELGYLQWMLFRAGRLVIDTGLHAKGWSRARAEAWFADLQGPPPVFAPIAQDVERAAIGPGSVAGQGLSWLGLVELRAAARRRQGKDFDLKAFHDAVLWPGTLPLAMLRAQVLG